MVLPDRPVLGPKHVLIVGCSELGAAVAEMLADQGYTIHVLDVEPAAFDRLPRSRVEEEVVVPLVGDGTTQEDLMRAGVPEVDVFMALTTSDTTNVLAAQVAKHLFQVEVVVCRVDTPDLQQMYSELGLIAIGATGMLSENAVQAAMA